MNAISLQSEYHSANQKTRAVWQENPGIGEIRKESDYDPVKFALATGIRPHMPYPVASLIRKLEQLMGNDGLADILPASGFHFTFLPLTLPIYEESEPLPAKVKHLTGLWRRYQAKHIVIRQLRLVALPSQLLLAGIPDDPAIAMRRSFCEEILASEWKNELLQRHAGQAIPAPFWHSTLLRYRAAYLPVVLRDFFSTHKAINFGDVSGELILARSNYNWTKFYPVSDTALAK